MHFSDDIAAADKFTIDENLWQGGPIGVFLNALADFFARKDIKVLDGVAIRLQDLDRTSGKSALTGLLGAFHKNNNLSIFIILVKLLA